MHRHPTSPPYFEFQMHADYGPMLLEPRYHCRLAERYLVDLNWVLAREWVDNVGCISTT